MKKQTIVAILLIILLQFSTFIVLRAEYNKPDCFDSIDNTPIESSVYVINNELNPSLKSTRNIKMTSLAYGGTGVLFTKVNNQIGVLTGGRGSATFNNRQLSGPSIYFAFLVGTCNCN